MKVTAERLPESQVRLEIVSDEEEFKGAVDKATKRLAQRVTVPGFRRGKAPRPLVERHVGRSMIVTEANGDLMDDLYRQALEQEDLTPVTRPSVEILQEEPLSFRVEVEVAPTVDVTGYEDVRVDPEHISVTDQEVDEYIDRMREDNSPWGDPPSPRPVQEGDQVVVDIAAFEGDEPFDEPTKDATFVLGRDNLLPQIRELILGAAVGEPIEKTISFPEENPEDAERPIPDALLGKTLTYRITVQSVKERELLPFDDELATSLGSRPQSLADLRADIRAGLLRQKEMQARVTLVNAIMEKMRDDVAKVELGPAIIQQQVEDDAAQQLQQLGGMGLDLKQIFGKNSPALENFLDRIRPESETRLKNTLILREIAKREEDAINVTHDDVHEEVHRLGMSHDVLEDERSVELIEADLRERKLLDRVIAIATEGEGIIDDSPPTAYVKAEEPDAHDHDHHHDDDEESEVVDSVATELPAPESEEQAVAAAEVDGTQLASDATSEVNAGTIDADAAPGVSDAPAKTGESPATA